MTKLMCWINGVLVTMLYVWVLGASGIKEEKDRLKKELEEIRKEGR